MECANLVRGNRLVPVPIWFLTMRRVRMPAIVRCMLVMFVLVIMRMIVVMFVVVAVVAMRLGSVDMESLVKPR